MVAQQKEKWWLRRKQDGGLGESKMVQLKLRWWISRRKLEVRWWVRRKQGDGQAGSKKQDRGLAGSKMAEAQLFCLVCCGEPNLVGGQSSRECWETEFLLYYSRTEAPNLWSKLKQRC